MQKMKESFSLFIAQAYNIKSVFPFEETAR